MGRKAKIVSIILSFIMAFLIIKNLCNLNNKKRKSNHYMIYDGKKEWSYTPDNYHRMF